MSIATSTQPFDRARQRQKTEPLSLYFDDDANPVSEDFNGTKIRLTPSPDVSGRWSYMLHGENGDFLGAGANYTARRIAGEVLGASGTDAQAMEEKIKTAFAAVIPASSSTRKFIDRFKFW
jgi:hypothetical protein